MRISTPRTVFRKLTNSLICQHGWKPLRRGAIKSGAWKSAGCRKMAWVAQTDHWQPHMVMTLLYEPSEVIQRLDLRKPEHIRSLSAFAKQHAPEPEEGTLHKEKRA